MLFLVQTLRWCQMQIEDPMLEDQQPVAQSSKKRKADPSKQAPATPHPKKQAKAEADSQEKPRSAPASAPAAVSTKQKKSDKAAAAVAPASQAAAAQKPSKAAAAAAAGASQAAAAEAEAPLSKSQLKKQRKKAQEAGSAAAPASDAPGTHFPCMCSAISLLTFEAVKEIPKQKAVGKQSQFSNVSNSFHEPMPHMHVSQTYVFIPFVWPESLMLSSRPFCRQCIRPKYFTCVFLQAVSLISMLLLLQFRLLLYQLTVHPKREASRSGRTASN